LPPYSVDDVTCLEIDLDLEHWWRENRASEGKPFSTDKPRVPCHIPLDDHWLIEEMRVESTVKLFSDPAYRMAMHKACNDRCEPALGIRPFGERPGGPGPRRIEEVFGCRIVLTEGATPWLEPGVSSIDELVALMDRAERTPIRDLMMTPEWEQGLSGTVFRDPAEPPRTRRGGSRGAATVATSVCGTEEALWYCIDHPSVMLRFFDLFAAKLIEYHRTIDGLTGSVTRGYGWADDHCALFSPAMYERFCFPAMKGVMDEFAPEPTDHRFQHSDGACTHLLPLLNELGYHGVNLGPTVHPLDIRRHMPATVIFGQVPPLVLRNGTPEEIVAAVRRDIDTVGGDGGLVLQTAGSIAAGTSLENIRVYMWAVQEYGRYG